MDRKEEKLQAIVEAGKQRLPQVIDEISNEFRVRRDYVVKPSVIDFPIDEDGKIFMQVKHPGDRGSIDYSLTPHSEGQLWTELQIPQRFARKLIELDEAEYLQKGMRTMAEKIKKEGMLLRTVGLKLKGVLSTRYKRMDASPIFESFIRTCVDEGFVPYTGYNTTNRYQLTFITPQVTEVMPKEFIVYAVTITTSDYGAGALAIDLGALRIWCENLMVGYDLMRKVHLGTRFQGDKDFIALSQDTMDLDTKTLGSATKDIVKQARGSINGLTEQIQLAGAVTPRASTWANLKKRIGKEVTEQARIMYNSGVEELLPEGKSIWRLSNTLAYLANSAEESDKKIDLQREAMELLKNPDMS